MTLFQPVSGCGSQCRDGRAVKVSRPATVLRLAAAAAVLLLGLVIVPVGGRRALPTVARGILAALGVTLRRAGPAVRPGSLLVANHVSWLDVLAILAVTPVRLVAKREVRGWAGIGLLAALSGMIFVDRTRPTTLPGTVAEVTAALRAGHPVAVFPEGTTFCGTTRGRFRPALFQAAVAAGAPVVPVSIGYGSTEGSRSTDAAFVGSDTLWSSVCRVARLRGLTVTMVSSPALHPAADADRRALARAAQASVGGWSLAA